MKTKIKFNEIKHSISAEDAIVTCDLSFSIDLTRWADILGFSGPYFDKKIVKAINSTGGIIVRTGPKLEVDMHVTARAKCHPQDTWDQEIGKQLATSRAKSRAFFRACHMYEALYNAYVKRASEICTMGLNAYHRGAEYEQACYSIINAECNLEQAHE